MGATTPTMARPARRRQPIYLLLRERLGGCCTVETGLRSRRMHVTAEPTSPGRLWYSRPFPRPAQGLLGRIPRVDARRLRLLHSQPPARRRPTQLHGQQRPGRCPRDRTLMFRVFGGSAPVSRRIAGAQAPADAGDPLVLVVRLPERVFDVVRDAFRLSRAVRRRHGRRLVRGDAARHRALPATPSRARLRPAQGGYALGVILAAAVYQFGYPLVTRPA